MVRKIKLPLEMANGVTVRTMEELRENWDLEKIIYYYNNGRLLTWLNDRYYSEQAKQVEMLEGINESIELHKQLCSIFEMPFIEEETVNIEAIAAKNEKLTKLKEFTADEDILKNVDKAAFDQEELADLLDNDSTIIYLVNNKFTIPLGKTNVTYIGVGKVIAEISSDKLVDFDKLGITLINVTFSDKYAEIERNEKRKIEEEQNRSKTIKDEKSKTNVLKPQDLTMIQQNDKINSTNAVSLRNVNEVNVVSESRKNNAEIDFKKVLCDGKGAEHIYTEAAERYKKAAILGNEEAVLALCELYRTKKVPTDNIEDTIKWFKRGANLGDVGAIIELAKIYCNEESPEHNYNEAAEWYIKAAVLGNKEAIMALSNLYCTDKIEFSDTAEAIKWLKKAAELGDVEAIKELAEIYCNEETPEHNYNEAAEWYKRAAVLGDEDALLKLCELYYTNKVKLVDATEIIKWLKRGANLDDVETIVELAKIYRDGKGIEQDYGEAADWFKKAAEFDNEEAVLELCELCRTNKVKSIDVKETIKWLERGAGLNDLKSILGLAKLYRDGKGVEQNYKKAAEWYKQAAELNNEEAISELFDLYRNNKVKDENPEIIKWYNRAAIMGNETAMFLLAEKYYKEEPKNYEEAVKWYKELAVKEDKRAINALYELYSEKKVKASSKEIEKWFIKAAEIGNRDSMLSLAQMYHYGEIINFDEAIKWYKLYIENNNNSTIATNALYKIYGDRKNKKEENKDEFLKWREKSADLGNPKAMYDLASAYYIGEDVPQDYQKALKWFKKAAELGNIEAMVMYANLIFEGEGITKDYNEAIKWYKKAGKEGDKDAIFALFRIYEDKVIEPKEGEIEYWFSKAADLGNCEAMFALAEMYNKGQHVQKNLKSAAVWYEKAAEAGHNVAMQNIGRAYYNGEGIEQDYNKAATWLMKTTDLEDEELIIAVAEMLRFGKGTKKNLRESVNWYQKVAENGNVNAITAVYHIFKNEDIKPQNLEEQIKWYKKAAEIGNADAMNDLATAYHDGTVVKQDYVEAIKLYEKAALLGNTDAMENLADMYSQGKGIQQDFEKAIKWYECAVEKGKKTVVGKLTDDYMHLALIYIKTDDLIKAKDIYKKAAALGNDIAMIRLAAIYEEGTGTSQNFEEAIKWYKKAAECGNKNANNKLAELYIRIGNSFETGNDRKLDIDKAIEYYLLAHNMQNQDGTNKLKNAYERRGNIARALNKREEAVEYYQKACELLNFNAMVSLGSLYGEMASENNSTFYFGEALDWLRLSIRHGNTNAATEIRELKDSVSYELRLRHFIDNYRGRFKKTNYYMTPDIPPKIVNEAIKAYGRNIDIEQIAILFDVPEGMLSGFSLGKKKPKKGFIITMEGLIITSFGQILPLKDIRKIEISGKKVFALPSGLPITELKNEPSLVDRFFVKMIQSEVLFNKEEMQDMYFPLLHVVKEMRKSFDTQSWIYLYPDIKYEKLKGAFETYARWSDEKPKDVMVLIDSTFFGKADEGCIVTPRSIYTSEGFEIDMNTNHRLTYKKSESYKENSSVLIDGRKLYTSMDEERDIKFIELMNRMWIENRP